MRFKRTDAALPREGRSRPDDPGRLRRTGRAPGEAALATAVGVLALLAVAGGVDPAAAQDTEAGSRRGGAAGWFPERSSFAPLLAAPREVGFRGSLILADRPDLSADFEGRNLEAEVTLGHRLAVLRLQPADAGRPEMTLGFEVGAFSRFHLETPERDLIAVDYRVGLPLSARITAWEARLTPVHVSSHVGDDFVARFDAPGGQFTRDGVDLVLARRIRGVRIYGNGTWNVHVNPGVPDAEAAFGVEWDPGPSAAPTAQARRRGTASPGLAAWPFVALDLRVTSRSRGPGTTGAVGAALRVSGTRLRLELRGHAGPTALGQLRGTDETFVGLGLRVEP